ncbi:hypothetical protein H6G33_34885 [Calothrix sp. FACHB-1219]|nr:MULTISPECIES: hypothetical protein [unclassified Calothrix]MBD2207528.1 hypothetical protein [Calothrix sp. FACHB-168]MBD2222129.1 hypothetical protein [Calothrix sp. FACHB-1219]
MSCCLQTFSSPYEPHTPENIKISLSHAQCPMPNAQCPMPNAQCPTMILD